MRKIHITLTVLISLGFALLGVFVFFRSYLRFVEGMRDLCFSVGFFFAESFGIAHDIPLTVLDGSEVYSWASWVPKDLSGFKQNAGEYFRLLVSLDNFRAWGRSVANFFLGLADALSVILPCIIIFYLIMRVIYRRRDLGHNRDTLPLRAWKKIAGCTYQPLKRHAESYLQFYREHRAIKICWLMVWLFNFNLISIAVEFFAFYFCFAIKFNVGDIFHQLGKLLIDLNVAFRYFPWWTLLTIAWLLFNRWRRKFAMNRLRHMEARNCGFINELPIVSITCGSMGKKKTTAITDMALSQAVMFRQKALSILQENDMKFPYFPWISFEDELRKCMEHGTVYNLATVKGWVEKKRRRFLHHGDAALQLYGYDVGRYGLVYDDALKHNSLFEVLSTYAQAYFIYVMESSLLLANYSTRDSGEVFSAGNFPTWYADFFPRQTETEGRFAHILDFDVLRLGKKVMENNPKVGSFEFGVVVISEVGKERGNNLELQEKKKKDEETNQKNDLFNAWLKMCRHSATVDNFPFIKVFTDEQRPESWGADARDLADILHIADCSDRKLAYPFYTIEEMISEWAFNHFINLYYAFRYRRGDNTLLVHLLKSMTACIWKRHIRICNKYGYSVLKIDKERGTMDGKAENKKYFLMNKKIYARRFSTDCFSDYFNDLARRSHVGLNDYEEYASERATVDELKKQHSYFIDALYKGVTP